MSDQKGLCALCGIQATSMCQRCYECYCSVNCQIEDWPKHKLICIPMPTLIPIQSIKSKRPSVNARLDRSNFLNTSTESLTRPTQRNFPLRKPQWYNQNDNNSESENAINSNLRKIEQKIPLSPPKEELNRSYQPNRTINNWRNVNNDRIDIPGKVKYVHEDKNLDKPEFPKYRHENNLKDSCKNESAFTNNGNSIDFSLKLRSKNSKDDSNSLTVDDIIEKLDDVLSSNNSEKIQKSKKAWRSHFPVQKDKFLEVVVQYISNSIPELVWVVDASYELACTALLKEINKHIRNETEPCPEEFVYVGGVVAAPFLGLYYRAVILEEKNPLNEVRVRLIDYGNDFYINVSQLKAPITVMKNVNAYAFCINYNGHAVEIGDSLTIKIIGSEDDIYKVEKEESKEEPPKDLKIKIINIFQKLHAIAIVEDKEVTNKLSIMREALAKDINDTFKMALPPVEGSFIVGKTSTSWERGFLLSSCESNYVMYCVDIGHIEILTDVKSVPNDFKNIPRQAALLTIDKDCNLEKYWKDDHLLQLKVRNDNEAINYDLYSCAEKLADNVKVSKEWNGCFADISIEYWLAGPKPNDIVQITHVDSHCEIYVCKQENVSVYSKMFNKKGQSAATTEAAIGKIVLGSKNGKFVRCKILNKVSNEVHLLDLDSGYTFKCEEKQIKEADNFVRYAPVFVLKVTLLHLNKITPCALNKAVAILKTCIQEKKKFTISFLNHEVELFVDASVSFNKQLIPLLFEELSNEGTNNKQNKIAKEPPNNKKDKTDEVPRHIESKIFQINDIEMIPLPTGEPIQIYVLDDSMIREGLITGCVFNAELLTKIQTVYADNIMKYCSDPSVSQEYSPREFELCFSIYEEDKQWYRAACLKKVNDDEFLVLFLDYGNTTVKRKNDLRPITKEFLYPTPANSCVIDGLPHPIPENLLKSVKSIVYTDALLNVSNAKKVEDSYYISIDEIKNLLQKD